MIAKKRSKENPITIEDLENLNERPYKIIEAKIKDGFCDFVYEIKRGVGTGQRHSVGDKKNIILDDLRDAFADLRVHLAFIDDAFTSLANANFNDLKNHEITHDYNVTSFKIKEKKGYQTIQLFGEKRVALGYESIDSVEVSLDNLGGYQWYNELNEAALKACKEVSLYAEGKCTPVKQEEDPKPEKQQAGLFDGEVEGKTEKVSDNDLEAAEV